MSKTQDLIRNMPLITGRVKQINGNGDIAFAINNMLNVINGLLKESNTKSSNIQMQNQELQDLLIELQQVISEKKESESINNKALLESITKMANEIASKIQAPVVSVEPNKEEINEIKKAIQKIKLPDLKELGQDTLKNLEKTVKDLSTKLDSAVEAISDISLDVPDQIKLSDANVKTELPDDAMELLRLLENLKTSEKNPLSVRLSDGKKHYDAVVKGVRDGVQAVALNSGNESPASTVSVSGVRTLSGSPIQLTTTSSSCRWVEVSAIKLPAAIGNSDTVYDYDTPANFRGIYLSPGNVIKIRIKDPSLLYVDGPSGGAVTYNCYA